jgi:hypothetical protein
VKLNITVAHYSENNILYTKLCIKGHWIFILKLFIKSKCIIENNNARVIRKKLV